MAGAVNAIDEYDGYKVINDESVIAAKPDIILTILAREGSPDVTIQDDMLRNVFGVADAINRATRPSCCPIKPSRLRGRCPNRLGDAHIKACTSCRFC